MHRTHSRLPDTGAAEISFRSSASRIDATPYRLILLIAALLGQLLLPTQALGETIDWTDASQLQPIPNLSWPGNGLFPSLSFTGNVVTISGGPTLSGTAFGGFTNVDDQEVSDNKASLSDAGEVTEDVLGGYSLSGNATGNRVNIADGSVGGNVYGGFAEWGGDTTGNTVDISGGSVGEYVYGGYSPVGNATHNTVDISGGLVTGGVYGGHGHDAATNNTVTISGGSVNENVSGGYGEANAAIVTGNMVSLSGGTVAYSIYGGNNFVGATVGNTVEISGGSVGWVYGGSSDGAATGNRVDISGGSVVYTVYGGLSGSNAATGNRVDISGGSVVYTVYGGLSGSDAATSNIVNISGGAVGYSVYGGISNSSSAATATGNTVAISGAPLFNAANTSLYGGSTISSSTGDLFTGNTLNFSADPVTVNSVANFQYYNFIIGPDQITTPLITAHNTITLGNGTDNSVIKVVNLLPGTVLQVGDEFLLMKASGGIVGNWTTSTWPGVFQQGSQSYDVEFNIDTNQVTVRILGIRGVSTPATAIPVLPAPLLLVLAIAAGLLGHRRLRQRA